MAFGFPISCCSIALRDQSIFHAARTIAQAGFTGIEIWYPHIETMGLLGLSKLRETCDNLGLQITVIAPYFTFTRGHECWERSLKTAEHVLEVAQFLGVKKIRTFTDCGPDGISSEMADESHWTAACDGLRKLCEMDPTMHFVVETHERTLASTLPSTRRLLEEVAMDNLRVNFQANQDFLQRGFMNCLEELFPSVSHMHWEQILPNLHPSYLEEEGLIDFSALIQFLQTKQYQGTASVEYCWIPVEEKRIHSAWNYLSSLLHEPAAKLA